MTTHEHAKAYAKLGWALVAIPAGSKGPTTFGWQSKATPPEHWANNPTHNIGLLHGLSGTVALDIDHMAHSRLICKALNIDLDAILASAPRIIGRADRGKVIFKAPKDQLTTRKIAWPVQGGPRKTEVIFELRAGSVQDVLPPSIHPDTGNPYRWEGDYTNLPELPEQLLTIWREWDRFRPQIMSLCPWAPNQAEKQPTLRKRQSDQPSVIDAYNKAVSITDALSKAGYKKIGTRWLSPNSGTGIPGVIVFDDGTAYSHHASDPFDPAHSFDAFEVYCQFEHMGSVNNAVKAAADWLQIDSLPQVKFEDRDKEREYLMHGAKVAEAFATRSEIPKHLLTIPGVLGDAVEFSNRTATKPQRQFDVQAALALGSVCMGRRWITDYDNMSSLYFLNVGLTGSGKEHANRTINRILETAQLPELIGPSGYTSASGILSALHAKPVHISIIDEFGNMLTSASAKGNHHKRDGLSMMMEAFGRQVGVLRNTGYATIGLTDSQKKAMDVAIHRPSLTILGMTTPSTFYEAIGGKDIASGFLNRFLIVESNIGRQKTSKPKGADVPESLINWCRMVATADGGGGNLQDIGPEFPPEPVYLEFGPDAIRLMDQFEDAILAQQDSLNNETLAAMLNRSREISMRLALIVAVSLGDAEITAEAMQWAIDYTDFYGARAISAMQKNMAEGEYDRDRKKAAEAIMRAGSVGLSIAELLKAVPSLGNMRKYDRDGILTQICMDYPIERVVAKTGKRGAPTIIHRRIIEEDTD
jgi:hypothetical protein